MAEINSNGAPKNILLAIGSARGDDRAVDRAFQLAAEWNASLTILHVITGSIRERARQILSTDELHDLFSKELAQHPHLQGLSIELVIETGNPAEQILIKSKKMKPDMIVMGVGHHDNLQKKFLGSTIDSVIRAATVPVLSVRSRAFETYQTILVLTDFSPPSQRAVETAIAFNPDSNVTVLHVCDAMPTVMGEDKLEILRNELSAKLTGTVCNGKNASNGGSKKQGCKIDTALEFGDTLNVIEYYVADNQPQLVVVGTHGRTGFMRAVLGSVAENLLKILPCDVLVVGSPDEAK